MLRGVQGYVQADRPFLRPNPRGFTGAPDVSELQLPPAVKFSGNPIIIDVFGDSPDGLKFMCPMYVRGILPSPDDAFYAYVSGHNSTKIWLYTAPHPLGPWTKRQTVLDLPTLQAAGATVSDHISSPWAIWDGSQILLFFHGVQTIQKTWLAVSNDGKSFTMYDNNAVLYPRNNPIFSYQFNAGSVTYVNILRDGGLYVAIYQASGVPTSEQVGNVVVAAGLAYSKDARKWYVDKEPIIVNPVSQRGFFATILLRVYGYWVVLSQNYADRSTYAHAAGDLRGPYYDLGTIIPRGGAGQWDENVAAPYGYIWWRNALYVYYYSHGLVGGEPNGRIGVAVMNFDRRW